MRNLQLDHFGAGGVHGGDIIHRGFLHGIKVHPIYGPDESPTERIPDASLLTVPIRHAHALVCQIMRNRGPDHPIIDCSGIMRTTNVGILLPFPHVHHLHCLFGPLGKGQLNALYCRGSARSTVFEHVLNNIARTSGETTIQLTPTTTETHDVVMSLVQGVAHGLGVLLAESPNTPIDDALRTSRNRTPAATLADMIHFNPRILPLVQRFTNLSLEKGSREAWLTMMEEMNQYLQGMGLDISRFKTPYFRMLDKLMLQFGCPNHDHLRSLIITPLDELTLRISQSQT